VRLDSQSADVAADLRVSRLQDPLPEGNFDLVGSALAVHHLDGAGKADLFARVADRLRAMLPKTEVADLQQQVSSSPRVAAHNESATGSTAHRRPAAGRRRP
jgi:hypothetical protein